MNVNLPAEVLIALSRTPTVHSWNADVPKVEKQCEVSSSHPE